MVPSCASFLLRFAFSRDFLLFLYDTSGSWFRTWSSRKVLKFLGIIMYCTDLLFLLHAGISDMVIGCVGPRSDPAEISR